MPTVKFIEHNGTEHVVEGNEGDSLMIRQRVTWYLGSTLIAAENVRAQLAMSIFLSPGKASSHLPALQRSLCWI